MIKVKNEISKPLQIFYHVNCDIVIFNIILILYFININISMIYLIYCYFCCEHIWIKIFYQILWIISIIIRTNLCEILFKQHNLLFFYVKTLWYWIYPKICSLIYKEVYRSNADTFIAFPKLVCRVLHHISKAVKVRSPRIRQRYEWWSRSRDITIDYLLERTSCAPSFTLCAALATLSLLRPKCDPRRSYTTLVHGCHQSHGEPTCSAPTPLPAINLALCCPS